MLTASRRDGFGGTTGRVGAIVLAAGESVRMGERDKMLIPLLGRPLVWFSLQVLSDVPDVGKIVLVVSREAMGRAERLVEDNRWPTLVEVCVGGARRQDSVREGLSHMQDSDWVIVHDGARPCAEREIFARGLQQAQETCAAVAAVPVKDTIKTVRPDMTVARTLARDGLWSVQTPQVFRTEILRKAHREVSRDVTDDASMVELIGGTVRIFMGSYDNIKVTTAEDLPVVEAVLRSRAGPQPLGTR